MADIFLASRRTEDGSDELLAVKILKPQFASDQRFQRMFLAEARTISRLRHPGVVRYHGGGEANGRLFMLMDFERGVPLSVFHYSVRAAEKPVPKLLAVEIVRQVAEALHYSHTLKGASGKPLGIIHRDVTPGNVMLTAEGKAKLIDFGIAKVADASALTKPGIIKGKFGYMAPEMVRGKGIDQRVDIFSLGVVLWQLLTGNRAFNGDTSLEVLTAVATISPPVPSEINRKVDSRLDRIVMRALARKPDQRFSTARGLAEALTSYIQKVEKNYAPAKDLRALGAPLFDHERRRLRAVLKKAGIAAPERAAKGRLNTHRPDPTPAPSRSGGSWWPAAAPDLTPAPISSD